MIAPLLGAKGFVLMDSRMQGESFSLDGGGEISYSAMADDAAALMDELGINEYDIVGYSDGGIIALLMAMKSFKVRRFFTIGANTDPSGLTAKAVREIKTALRRANHKGDERTAALLSMMLNEPHITSHQLAGIIAEATIILGKKDTVIDRKHSERIADAIPHGTHVLIEGAGHDVPRNTSRSIIRPCAHVAVAAELPICEGVSFFKNFQKISKNRQPKSAFVRYIGRRGTARGSDS